MASLYFCVWGTRLGVRPSLCWFLVCTFLRRTILSSVRCTSGAFVCVDSKPLFK